MRTIAVWTGSALLALVFLITGAGKLLASPDQLTQGLQQVPIVVMRVAGVAEVLGALGLLVPAATRIVPSLTPIAAAALTLQMLAATATNVVTGHGAGAVVTAALAAAAALLAWARLGPCRVVARPARPQAGLTAHLPGH